MFNIRPTNNKFKCNNSSIMVKKKQQQLYLQVNDEGWFHETHVFTFHF